MMNPTEQNPPNHHPFPKAGFVRLSSILAPNGPIPVSKSTWWAGVKTGRYPKPVKLGPRITVWRAEDIWALLEAGVE
jgi:prophage regulatory protein